METKIYFVRHAQSDNSVKDEMTRPLTEKGMKDRFLAEEYLRDKGISEVYSSPYLRAVKTVEPLGLEVKAMACFRERTTGEKEGIENFAEKQWRDFDFKAPGGESLGETQERALSGLSALVQIHKGASVAIGSHGTAIGTVINYFVPSFDYNEFLKIKDLMPLIAELTFNENNELTKLSLTDLFKRETKTL